VLAHSLVLETKGILEQPFSTSLPQLQTHMFIRVTVEKLWRPKGMPPTDVPGDYKQWLLTQGDMTPIYERL